MIPGHRITRNESTRIPRRFIYLDTEARQTGETTKVQTWRLACTAYTAGDGRQPGWSAPQFQTHRTPDDLWSYIDSKTRRRRRTVLVAHNLAYDLRIARAFHILPSFGWRLDRMGLHDRSLTVTFRRNDRSLVMVDSTSWLPASLGAIAHSLGLSKTPLPSFDDEGDEWERRCLTDVAILHAACQQMLDWHESADLGNWQRTGAGMAWANWRHAHYDTPVFVHGDANVQAIEAESTYPGRCEAWEWGEHEDGPFEEWDLPLAYPRVCLDSELPTRLGHHVFAPSLALVCNVQTGRRILCKARVDTVSPTLPIHGATGVLWPSGTFTGWYWDVELANAIRYGANVVPLEAWVYPSAPFLADWAQWICETAEGSGDDVPPMGRLAAKHWGRALIGRFASKYSVWEEMGHAPYDAVEASEWLNVDTGAQGKRLTLGSECWLSTEETYGEDAFPAVQSLVLAESRVRLWQIMQTAGLANTLYCDTDSVIVDRIGASNLERATANGRLWGLRPKREWAHIEILGPRQLTLDGVVKYAGVPLAAKRTAGGKLVAERWEGLGEALKLGHADQVIIRPTEFTLLGKDNRRTHLDGGKTETKLVRL